MDLHGIFLKHLNYYTFQDIGSLKLVSDTNLTSLRDLKL